MYKEIDIYFIEFYIKKRYGKTLHEYFSVSRPGDEELIIDGWHRFHSYVRKDLDKVPVLGIYRD